MKEYDLNALFQMRHNKTLTWRWPIVLIFNMIVLLNSVQKLHTYSVFEIFTPKKSFMALEVCIEKSKEINFKTRNEH
jgi:hypothetical protein